MTTQEKANNAIIWIDGLSKTRVKQGIGKLGDSKTGYCCLGYGCMKLKIPYHISDPHSIEFKYKIGLIGTEGSLKKGIFKNTNSVYLTDLNDKDNYSFNKISKEIKNNLENLFEEEVAEILIKHYENS